MESIRIQNLRALKDTNSIELKPLTVLVGKNSSGKSTLLRFFPLMKQTLETRTNEPILWYSPAYVDFGSFDESINHDNNEKSITFEFTFTISKEQFDEEVTFFAYRSKYFKNIEVFENIETQYSEDEMIKINLAITFSKKKINSIQMNLWDHKIEYLFQDKDKEEGIVEVLLNGIPIRKGKIIRQYFTDYTNMLPSLLTIEEESVLPIERHFNKQLFKLISNYVPASTKDKTIDEAINSIKLGDSTTMLKSLKELKSTSKTLEKKLRALTLDHEEFRDLKNNYFGMIMNGIVDICNQELKSFFSSVRYIAPLRASAERYYRIQGLSLDEIDPQGANIPMLLNNMSNKVKRSFNMWIKENFRFDIVPKSTGGHTSLYIRYENGTQINLADTGFGYSQILPIILVLWQAVQRSEEIQKFKFFRVNLEDNKFTIAIEQPELHLHPSLQAMLIDTFAKIIKVSKKIGIDLKIIIETHSETMINRIGQIIATNYEEFNEELVNVLIFNSDHPYDSNITSTSYTEDGFLTSWPIGFFSPEEI